MLYVQFGLAILLVPPDGSALAVSAAMHHFALDGDVVQPCAFEPRVVLFLAVLTLNIAIRNDLFLMLVHHTAVEVVVELVQLQDTNELFELELHAVTVLTGHDVVVELRVAGEDVAGGQDALALPLADADGLYHSAVKIALRFPISEVELAHTDDDQLVELCLVSDDVLAGIVDFALKGPVQLCVCLLLKVGKDWDVPVQLLILLKEVLLSELLGQTFDDGSVLIVLELVPNLSLVAEVAFDLPPQLIRHRVFLGHPSQDSELPL